MLPHGRPYPVLDDLMGGFQGCYKSLQVVIGLLLTGIEGKSLAIKQAKGAFRWAHVELLEIQKRGSGVCVHVFSGTSSSKIL